MLTRPRRLARPPGLAAAVLAALLGAAAACDRADPPAAARPLVAASFYPLYEFSRAVAGDRAEVFAMVPPGVEPHDWEPSPQAVARIRQARVVVYNGAGFEPWMDRLLGELPGDQIIVNATHGLALQAPGPAPDPHVWLDPLLARGQVEAIRAALARADPEGAGAYDANARALGERLDRLDRAFAEGLADCARRDLVVSHGAFGYLARRYGLTQVPIAGLSPSAEPSPAHLAALARLARRRGVRYVFFETLVSPRLAETLAREVGARTLVLDPIEGLADEDRAAGRGYVELMERNLRQLRTGLDCR